MQHRFFQLLAILLFSLYTSAQTSGENTTVDDLYMDFAIPDLSAFTLLQATPSVITKPGNLKELSGDVLSLVGNGNQLTGGIALEYSPWFTIERKRSENTAKLYAYTYKDYMRQKIARGSAITFGTVQDDAGSRAAIGLKMTVLDQADPLLDQGHIRAMNMYLRDMVLGRQNIENEWGLPMEQNLNNLVNFLEDKEVDEIIIESLDQLIELQVDLGNESKPLTDVENYILELKSGLDQKLDSFFMAIEKDLSSRSIIVSLEEMESMQRMMDEIKDQFVLFQREQIMWNQTVKDQLSIDLRAYLEDYKRRNWNRLGFAWGMGWIFNFPDNSWNSFQGDQLSAYINFSTPLSSRKSSTYEEDKKIRTQLVFLGQYNGDFSTDSAQAEHAFRFAGRLLVGSHRFRISVDANYTVGVIPVFKSSNDIMYSFSNSNELVITVGTEFQIMDGMWLEFAFGGSDILSENQDASFLSIGNLKYAFRGNSRSFYE